MKQLPDEFCDMLRGLCRLEPRVDGLLDSLSRDVPTVAVRVNPRKLHPDVVDVNGAIPVGWWQGGVYLPQRPVFTLDPALHQGRYYVQDPSSMYIGHVIRQLTGDNDRPLAYLDACAAPGGKATTAIDALPDGSLVVANEYDFRRAEILNENVAKWGYPGVIITRGDTSRFLKTGAVFDIIAADVPCSGEGMMRKDDDAVAQWSTGLVKQCATLQRRIVHNLWGALKPGGYFIYSTCTFNREENEVVVEELIDTYGAESISIGAIRDFPEILPAIGNRELFAARFMPHMTRGEGLFISVLRKPGILTATKSSRLSKPPRLPFKLPEWFPANLTPMICGDVLYGLPQLWQDFAGVLNRHLDVVRQGVEVAIVKGRDVIPAHGLAMLSEPEIKVQRVELSHEQALNYLRREALTVSAGAPRGFVLATYQSVPLGWIKNLGNRANNLYPQNWRIRNL